MKLTIRDGIASVLLLAILVPYVGYLINGSMPFIQDPRGMAATALVLGAAAFLTAGRFTTDSALGIVELVLVSVSLAFGVVVLFLAETAAAETLLAVLITAIIVTWAVQMTHHAGLLDRFAPTAGLHH